MSIAVVATLANGFPLFLDVASARLRSAGAQDIEIRLDSADRAGHLGTIALVAPDRLILDDLLLNLPASALTVDGEPIDIAGQRTVVTTRFGDVPCHDIVWKHRVINVVPDFATCEELGAALDAAPATIWIEAFRLAESRIGLHVQPRGNAGR